MTSGTDMLRKLASGIRPQALGGAPSPLGRADVATSGFSDLLNAAQGGQLKSDRPVTREKGATMDFSADQLTKLGQIADQAELDGCMRVLVQMDDQWVTLDVGARTVNSASAMKPETLISGYDAIYRNVTTDPGPAPAAMPDGADLLKALGKRT